MTPADMEALLRNLDARFQGMEQILPTLATRVDLRELGTTVGGLDTRMGRVEVRLDAVEVRLGLVEGRLDAVEARLGAVEDRLGRVEDTQHRILILVEDTRDDMRLLSEHVVRAMERIERHH